jgi:hypothetical protein
MCAHYPPSPSPSHSLVLFSYRRRGKNYKRRTFFAIVSDEKRIAKATEAADATAATRHH